jgi:hypothetical protein
MEELKSVEDYYNNFTNNTSENPVIEKFMKGTQFNKKIISLSNMEEDSYYLITKLKKVETKFGLRYFAETANYTIVLPDRYCENFTDEEIKSFEIGGYCLVNKGKDNFSKRYNLELVATPDSQKRFALVQ